jgi:hypothetical protein
MRSVMGVRGVLEAAGPTADERGGGLVMAPLLIIGGSVLLFRTIALLHGGARTVLRSRVVALTYMRGRGPSGPG